MITILACIIALIGGVMGMNYVSDQKEIKTKEGDEARANIDTLKEGMATLESKRDAYNTGKATYDAGLEQYNAGLKEYEAGMTKAPMYRVSETLQIGSSLFKPAMSISYVIFVNPPNSLIQRQLTILQHFPKKSSIAG